MTDDHDLLPRLHKLLLNLNKRAERTSDDILVETFVDSAPLFDLLATTNNQVIFGRRGTGKTHALKYLAKSVAEKGEHPVYLDLRAIGSNGSIYNDPDRPLAQRAATLIQDVLAAIHDELLNLALERIDRAPNPEQITARIDDLANSITTMKVYGTVEFENQANRSQATGGTAGAEASFGAVPGSKLSASVNSTDSASNSLREKRVGTQGLSLSFGDINAALAGLIAVLGAPRIWLLIDEWSEVPLSLQPYLADLVRRTILPVNLITVKIAAIEHRSQFAIVKERGEYLGVELGADMSADLNLDDFLVFENDQDKATDFFKNLIFKHVVSESVEALGIDSSDRFIQTAFTQWPAFEEFVRAVEGVPRDALYLANKISTKAFGQKIAMQHVRAAARDWYQQDKAAVIRANNDLSDLLAYIVDEVIGKRRARAFLFPSNQRDYRIELLFDSRLLHILKKNVSSHDEPGSRYDVYKIDYGCYVDLINTSRAPQGLLEEGEGEYAEVPKDDYRSIRRAILRLEKGPPETQELNPPELGSPQAVSA